MSAKIISVLLLTLFSIYCEARYGCPTIQVLSRCSTWCRCTTTWINADYNYKTVFRCDGFNGRLGDLDDWLKMNLDGADIDDFVFNNYKLDRLPNSVFQTTSINRIIISNSPLLKSFGYRESGKTVFEGLGQTLETLIITNSPNIEMDEWKAMANSLSAGNTPVLKNLIVYYQSSTTITELAHFNSLINLQRLIWRYIGLEALNDPTIDLTPFTKLRLLDLSQNKLGGNFDAKLPPSLTTIYLNGNRDLKGFTPAFFTQLNSSNVGYINVRDPNQLDCSCDIVDVITGTQLGTIFEGTCASPPQVRGKAYGAACFYPPNIIKTVTRNRGNEVKYEFTL